MDSLAVTLRELGDLQGARELDEHVLDGRKRVLGPEHPDTSVSAWNLLGVLDQLGEAATAWGIANEHLNWLLSRDPESLGADQRKIRDMLMQRRK